MLKNFVFFIKLSWQFAFKSCQMDTLLGITSINLTSSLHQLNSSLWFKRKLVVCLLISKVPLTHKIIFRFLCDSSKTMSSHAMFLAEVLLFSYIHFSFFLHISGGERLLFQLTVGPVFPSAYINDISLSVWHAYLMPVYGVFYQLALDYNPLTLRHCNLLIYFVLNLTPNVFHNFIQRTRHPGPWISDVEGLKIHDSKSNINIFKRRWALWKFLKNFASRAIQSQNQLAWILDLWFIDLLSCLSLWVLIYFPRLLILDLSSFLVK